MLDLHGLGILGACSAAMVTLIIGVDLLYIRFIGTHAQYDAIDAETVEMEHSA